MDTIHTKKFVGTPFIITSTEIENSDGKWNSSRIAIYRDENLVGEYIRNYNMFGPMTFYPFNIGEQWYALYSPHYTATRVMKINSESIEDWCGEEPSSTGFCPVEYYIPRYNYHREEIEYNGNLEEIKSYNIDTKFTSMESFVNDWKLETFIESKFCNFAFLCGCQWGDDSSWKLRYIDLSKIENKILKVEEKFGYWELPTNINLRQCINMENWEPDHNWIELTGMKHVNLQTGQIC